MSFRDSRARLDRLAAELRAQPLPTPPHDLSSRLRAEFRRVNAAGWPAAFGATVGAAAPAGASFRWRVSGAAWLPRLVAVSALALGAAFVAGRWARTSGPRSMLPAPTAVVTPSAAPSPAATSPATGARGSLVALLEGEPLAVGAPVTALDQPRRVEHPGRASWVLAPGSRGRVLSASGVLRIALEHGSLDAEVLPSRSAAAQTQNLAESFIVESRGTEVAVHGTRFRVTLSGERTRVTVSQGQVVVRPLRQSEGTTLDAGMSAEFRAGVVVPAVPPVPAAPATSLSGSAQAVSAQPRTALRQRAAAAAASKPGVSAARTVAAARRDQPAPAPSLPSHAPSAVSVEPALRAITERVQGCFRRHTSGPSGLGIELSTELAVSVEPSGELLQANFEPPLAPAVEACVAAELEQLRLEPSPEGYRVQREIRLHR